MRVITTLVSTFLFPLTYFTYILIYNLNQPIAIYISYMFRIVSNIQ